MNDDFEQEVIEEGISGDEPLISHNHSNDNNYANRNNGRNNTQRRTRGRNLGQRRNNKNNNPLTRNNNGANANNNGGFRNGVRNGVQKALTARRNGAKGINKSRNNSQNKGNNESNETSNNKTNNIMNDGSESKSSSKDSDGILKIKIPLVLKVKIALIGLGAIAVIMIILAILAVFMAIFGTGTSTTKNIYTDPESENKGYCKELEVTFYKKVEENGTTRYEINEEVGEMGVATYDLETYVAGVISGEVGVLKNEEVWKAFAVAARTYGLIRNTDCKIESSDRYQVMLPGEPAEQFKKAAKDTEGEVLLDKDDKLVWSTYDAFACYQKDEEYYYIKQGNIIPIKWLDEEFPNLNSKWTSCTMQQAHGDGMSQYGAYYLAEVYGYSYHELLNYYYGDLIKGFYCVYEEVEGSCPEGDTECEPEYVKVCE